MGQKRFRWMAALAIVAALLVAACTSGESSDDASDSTTDGTSATTAPSATGPSPGVTADTIKVGVTYVDAAALVASGLNYDLGDYEGAYTALFDQINADGGINGRQIEPVFAPIDPTGPDSAAAACVKLTEDEDVFVVAGFFLTDSVTCPVATHATAVVGGDMTPQRTAQAQAPWISWSPDTDQPEASVRALADQGALDGKVALFSNVRDQDEVDQVTAVLDDLGITPVETGIVDAPADDQAAVRDNVKTIAQRFEAAGADTVLNVGLSSQDWPTNMADDPSYRPDLRFLEFNAPRSFLTNAATTDTSVLDGSIVGGSYGPDQAKFDDPTMQDCVQTLTDAGVDVPSPDSVGSDPSNQPYQAAFFACPDVALLKAWLDAAGPNLNYGTLAAAIDGLQVTSPGDPTERTYGAPPDADGNPAAYLFNFDTGAQDYVVDDSGTSGGGGDSTTTTGG